MIYLDSAATSPLLPEAKSALLAAYDSDLGNASSLHSAGSRARLLIENSRRAIAQLIHADPSDIIFTSGGTESNNTVMHIFSGHPIFISPFEHPSVSASAKIYGAPCHTLALTSLVTYPTDQPILISHQLANSETGELFTLPKIPKTAYLHSDLTQALGKIPLDVTSLHLDYATLSAHKIGGPIGIGALYVRGLKHSQPLEKPLEKSLEKSLENPQKSTQNNRGTGENLRAPYSPLIFGGHQENNHRAGTLDTPLIASFGAAAEYALTHQTWDLYATKIRPLRDQLAKRILREIPGSTLNTDLARSLPNILNVSFHGAEGESIQLSLDYEKNIIVSTGSACASGDGEPSPAIMAKTHDPERAHSSIRFSFTLSTTQRDIDELMTTLPKIIKNLQGISTI